MRLIILFLLFFSLPLTNALPAGNLPMGSPLTFPGFMPYCSEATAVRESSFQNTGEDNTITAEAMARNAYALFEHLRSETGVYTDAAVFNGEPYHPASVATTGMGLVALCIADAMGWVTDAEKQVLETLEAVSGLRAGFLPARNCKGWFRHFIWQDTGERAWNSEFSSIDTGILVAGALFCKQYFKGNLEIASLANNLYLSIDWSSMIDNADTGALFLTANKAGNGLGRTLPFNEYMIVAWMSRNDFRDPGPALDLWNKHYTDPAALPTSRFMDIELLTDQPGNYLSGFIPQFTYYLCHAFSTSEAYLSYFAQAMEADRLWWEKNTDEPSYIWGFGAGAAAGWVGSGYHADNLDKHPGTICSPHIIAGAIPVFPEGLQQLIELHEEERALYQLPDTSAPILWRFSAESPGWRATDIQGIDFSTLLMGLAAHPALLGRDFFETHNDFDFPNADHLNEPPNLATLPDTIVLQPTADGKTCTDTLSFAGLPLDPDGPAADLQWAFLFPAPQDTLLVTQTDCMLAFSSLPQNVEWTITTVVRDRVGATAKKDIVVQSCTITSGKTMAPGEGGIRVLPNFPNPFSYATTFRLFLPRAEELSLLVFDQSGRTVLHSDLGLLPAGPSEYQWEGKDDVGNALPAGMYYFQLLSNRERKTGKLSIIR